MFPKSRDVGTNAAEDLTSVMRAKTCGYFLFQFHHPDIPHRLIIVKWDQWIGYKTQNFTAMVTKHF